MYYFGKYMHPFPESLDNVSEVPFLFIQMDISLLQSHYSSKSDYCMVVFHLNK